MVGLFMLAVALLATSTAYAGFQARATATSAVSSGTLDLVQSADIGHGFSAFVAPAAPGDQDNVYVNVSNTGSLATVAGMKLWVAATPANALTNGQVAGEGLTARLSTCSVAWTLATGACSGTTTPILATTSVSGLAVPAALSNIPAMVATTGQVAHVRVSLGLTATETSLNGVSPTPTIQGLSTTLTYTFTEVQRTGVATNQ